MQLCSMFIFRGMTDLLTEEGKKALKSHVRQSLLPLSFHCHDQNQRVLVVRTGKGLGCPCSGTWRAAASSWPWYRDGVLCPGLWCHLWVPAALQASRVTLRCSAAFLKRRDIEQMLRVDQTWRFGEGLVRTSPSLEARRGSRGSSRPCARSRTRLRRPNPGAVRAGEVGELSPHQPQPPGALSLSRSWQRTRTEQPSTCAGPCCTWAARRSLCDRRPSGSSVSPGLLPHPGAAAAAAAFLCCWGCDGLCVLRDGRAAPQRAQGTAPARLPR